MAVVPETSTTLLRDLAADSRHARWAEFIDRYRPMMEAFLRRNFPQVEVEDLVQETFIALVDILRNYRYAPDETGAFRNYLTGILRHRALHVRRGDMRRSDRQEEAWKLMDMQDSPNEQEERAWREAIYEIALRQFREDETIRPEMRQVFERVAVKGESAQDVAVSLQMTRANVDKIKSRAMAHVRKIVQKLAEADGHGLC